MSQHSSSTVGRAARPTATLITGANGEVGHGLIQALHDQGRRDIVTIDLRELHPELRPLCRESLVGDVTDESLLGSLLSSYEIGEIYHLAALLSTSAEFDPERAHRVNVGGTLGLLEFAAKQARSHGSSVKFLFPSSIAVFGLPDLDTKREAGRVGEDDFLRPTTMYGCNKLYCEHLGRYYSRYYKQLAKDSVSDLVDFRCVRYPGLISADTVPTGGTSDFAPEMLHQAAQNEPYDSFVRADARIPFLAMPDAIEALLKLANADRRRLTRQVYNLAGFSPSAGEFAELVEKHFPDADTKFDTPDTQRQSIVDSWPEGRRRRSSTGGLGLRAALRPRRCVRRVPRAAHPRALRLSLTMNASLVIPTWNGGRLLGRVLEAVERQPGASELERIAIDSGSSDDTVRTLQKHGFDVEVIDQREFDHGLTRDRAIAKCSGDVVMLLSQDALPADENWLPALLDCYASDPRVGAAYCRQIPRDDCNPFLAERLRQWTAGKTDRVVQHACSPEEFAALDPMQRLQRCAYDNVAGSVRRAAWQEHPFGHRRFGEDVAFGKRLILGGWNIVFEPRSAVVHSHNRSARAEGKRIFCDHDNLRDLFGVHLTPDHATFRHQVHHARRHYSEIVDGLGLDENNARELRQWARSYAAWATLGMFLGGNRTALSGRGRRERPTPLDVLEPMLRARI
jgi:threonine 3-dehydrogenase